MENTAGMTEGSFREDEGARLGTILLLALILKAS